MRKLLFVIISIFTISFAGFAQFTMEKDTVWMDLDPAVEKSTGKHKISGNLTQSTDVKYELVFENATSKKDWFVQFCDCNECKDGLTPNGNCTIDAGASFPFVFYCTPKGNIDTAYVTYKVTNVNDASNTAYFTWATRATPKSVASSAKESTDLLVFPNPTNGIVNISMENSISKEYSISVVNILGETLMKDILVFDESNTHQNQIDLSGYEHGFYFLNLSNEDEVITKRISLR